MRLLKHQKYDLLRLCEKLIYCALNRPSKKMRVESATVAPECQQLCPFSCKIVALLYSDDICILGSFETIYGTNIFHIKFQKGVSSWFSVVVFDSSSEVQVSVIHGFR